MVTLTGSPDDLNRAIAARVPGRPLVAVADRRANLSPAVIAACDAIVTPRLGGEVDIATEAANLAEHADSGEVRPTMATVRLPMAVGDAWPFAAIDEFAADQRLMPLVLASGVVLGGQGAVKEWGVTVVVVTDFDIAFARNLADDLAEAVWERRAEFTGEVPGRADPGRPRPMWPFEPAEWRGESFAD